MTPSHLPPGQPTLNKGVVYDSVQRQAITIHLHRSIVADELSGTSGKMSTPSATPASGRNDGSLPSVSMIPHLRIRAAAEGSPLSAPISADTKRLTQSSPIRGKKKSRKSPRHARSGRQTPADPPKLISLASPSSAAMAGSETWAPSSHEKHADGRVPAAAPLDIIESAVPHDGHLRKSKLSKHAWSVSAISIAGTSSQKDGWYTPTAPPQGKVPKPLDRGQPTESPSGMDTGCVTDWQFHVSAPVLKENPANAFLNNPISHEHDIDPSTGEFLPATPYPSTLLAEEEPDGNEFGKETTSNHQITREIKVRERLAETLWLRRQQRKEILQPEPKPEPAWPSADCTLRPAAEKDFEQIARIINSERPGEICPQVLGSKSVTVRDIRGIFGHCRANLRPFIVAYLEEEDFLDRSKWPKGSEKVYHEYVKLKRSRPAAPSAIVGFAFVAEARLGFFNHPCPGSRFTGQIRLIVHPQHRQKGYGTALLDRILLSVAPYHRGLIDYTWRCDEPSMIYELPTAAHNRRRYTHVFIENLSRKDAEMPWKRKLLDKFDFKQAACFEETARTDRGCDSTWLDLEVWQHKTTYRVLDDQPGEYLAPK